MGGRAEGMMRGGLYRAVEIQAIEKLLCFFPLYLRMWNNTVMILFSRIELCASKQYYFLTSLLPLFVCSTRIMCWEGWGKVGWVSFSYMIICLFPPLPTEFCKYHSDRETQ